MPRTQNNKYKRVIGVILLVAALIALLYNYYFIDTDDDSKTILFFTTIAGIIGLGLVLPYELLPYYIFDPEDYKVNTTLPDLVLKLRYRALLFNNISVIVFTFIILVIFAGFYLLFAAFHMETAGTSEKQIIALTISVSVLLIFLVQILFKLFKYLIRVAAFYNGKADAFEANAINSGMSLTDLMGWLTPEKYDIAELESPSISEKILTALTGK